MNPLRALILALMHAIHPGAEHQVDAERIGDAIESALLDDARANEPLTGSVEGDAALMVEYAYQESAFRARTVGDGGKSLGAWQLQRVTPAVGFDPMQAARIWLARAHASWCRDNPPGTELAALASGSCERGRKLVKWRWENAARLLASVRERDES